jgi:two-component system OmpR family response regulator
MNATPLRILIVDDHADNARMLKVLLKTAGHEAGIVLDGPAAIAAANHQKPDVVLLDLSLPGMSGIEVANELRRNPDRSRCVLVAVTGHGKDRLPSPSPFDGYFAKPLDFVSLIAYLSEIPARQEPPSWTSAVA